MRTVVLNNSNLIQDGLNNKLVYKFPNSVVFKDNSIAVASVAMYYSWFNITSSMGNNFFQYSFWDTATSTIALFDVLIPDGLYQVLTLNAYLQFIMIQNGHYLVDANSKNVYYLEMILNPSRYAVQQLL